MKLPLMLVISLVGSSPVQNDRIVLNTVFENVSDDKVRILDSFDVQKNLPIWFQVQMVRLDGTPVSGVRGGGKINLRGTLKYVTLKPGERFQLQLDIAKMMTERYVGDFKISLLYRNQYGQDCFKGVVNSNTLALSLVDRKPDRGGKAP